MGSRHSKARGTAGGLGGTPAAASSRLYYALGFHPVCLSTAYVDHHDGVVYKI
jgi:hypothetical protein